MPLDAKALAAALKIGRAARRCTHELCRKDAGAFEAALGDDDDVSSPARRKRRCSASSPTEASAIRFVNIRELAGWSAEGKGHAEDRGAARDGRAARARAGAARSSSSRRASVLIVGPAAAALDWAERLAGQLDVTRAA